MFFSFSVLIISLFSYGKCFLDIEELQSMNYGIDILDKPVAFGNENAKGAILMKSKYGQSYQCTYPDVREEETKENEEEKIAIETGIPELLKPLESGSCLVHTKGWWTYEVCVKDTIKQYHAEDGKPSGKIMSLGNYESEYDWSNYTFPSGGKKHSKIGRLFHSQYYNNGSLCELTGALRRTEVKFTCKENQANVVFSVDEPETCVYVINVQTSLLCHHPYLKPPTPNQPVPITCNPLLSEEDFNEYMEEQNEREKATQAVIERMTDRQAEESSAEGGEQPAEQEEDKASGDVFMESLIKGIKDALEEVNFGSSDKTSGKNQKTKVSSSTESNDLGKSAQHDLHDESSLTSEATGHVRQEKSRDYISKEEMEDSASPNRAAEADHMDEDEDDDDDEDDEDGEDADLVAEFDEELKELSQDSIERLSKVRDSIEEAVQGQFDAIVNEAEGELEGEGLDGEVDKQLAFKQLASTLSKLLKRLDSTENEIKSMDEEIERKLREVKKRSSDGDEDAQDDDDDDFDEDGSLITFADEQTADSQAEKHSNSEVEEETQVSNKPRKVKVKVSHTELRSNSQGHAEDLSDKAQGQNGDQSQGQSDDKTQSLGQPQGRSKQLKKASLLDDSSQRKVAESVKERIEQTGIDTSGRKVEVKIITEYFDDGDLTTEEGNNKIVIAVLAGNDGEVQEQYHQHQMEKAYSFDWQSKKSKNKRVPIH